MVFSVPACAVHAAADRFDYDSAGRLIRRIDDQSRGTDYVYDPAGNVVQVTGPGQVQAPSIASGPLGDQRRNEVRTVSVSGTGLAGVSIRVGNSNVIISNVISSASAASFRLAVTHKAPLGAQELVFQTAAGTVALQFNVVPALGMVFVPTPIGVPPDNIGRKVPLLLSEPLVDSRIYNLTTLTPAIARPNVAQFSLAPGQIQVDVGIIGVKQGATALRLSGPSLYEAVETLVFVGAGLDSRLQISGPVGVMRATPVLAPANSLTASGGIGVVRGTSWGVSASVNPFVAPLVGITRP